MIKKSGIVFLAAFLAFLAAEPVILSAETFEEYRERTRREQEEQRRRQQEQQQQQQQNNDEQKDNGWADCIGNCLGAMLQGMCKAMAEDNENRAPDQPNSPDRSTPDFSEPAHEYVPNAVFPYAPGGDKFWAVELRGNIPFLFAGDGMIFGFAPQLNITLGFFHLNASYEHLADSTSYVDTFAFHAGFAIPIERILVAVYAGVFIEPSIPYTGFSFGAQMRIYVTENVMWTLDGFCSIDGSIFYTGGSTTVGFIIDRFVLGVGADIKNFNGMFMWGPSVNLSLWM